LAIRDLTIKGNKGSYEYIDGVLKYNEKHTILRTHLLPGRHVLYAKIDPSLSNKNLPENANLVVYSNESVKLDPSSQANHPDLLKRAFSDYARKHKKQLYNNDLMWSSWKLIAHGGYAFIAFGNQSESDSKFVIKFSEK
jgi:hypothetical protein